MTSLIVSKQLSWINPYLAAVKKLLPIEKLTRITARKPASSRAQHEHANLKALSENDFRILIMMGEYHSGKFHQYTKIDLLESLAHELSHLYFVPLGGMEWRLHTPHRKIMEAAIMIEFMLILKDSGYISEEIESATIKKTIP